LLTETYDRGSKNSLKILTAWRLNLTSFEEAFIDADVVYLLNQRTPLSAHKRSSFKVNVQRKNQMTL